ncbi:MAG TPA: 1-acyl-sn-glycerol-3-phosphate acyltransferase [Candidatus Marinimicrobia bacterium]|nr:1-acyl-sn-glycerol-3-phosphate acyltransferase [Candidatus Neomarinimicrobiota bacterium]
MFLKLRVFRKLFLIGVCFLLVAIIVAPLKLLLAIFSQKLAWRFAFYVSRWVGWSLAAIMGARLRFLNEENIPRENGFLVVSNHFGYIELMATLARLPMVFVAKEEVKRWPIIGMANRIGGAVFVDRYTGGRSEKYGSMVYDALRNRINVFFSPEGTTSDGTFIRRFKSPLFVPANRLKVPVLPVVISIDKINGENLNPDNRDLVTWHSDMKFVLHFLAFLELKSVDLTIRFLKPTIPDYDDSDLNERRRFSASIRQQISEVYRELHPGYREDFQPPEPDFIQEKRRKIRLNGETE